MSKHIILKAATIKRQFRVILYALILVLLLSSCSGLGSDSSSPTGDTPTDGEQSPTSGGWDSTPQVLIPEAPETEVIGNETVNIDISNSPKGYIMARYVGENPKVKMIISLGEGEKYTYNLNNSEYVPFPLTQGSGEYMINVYENISGEKYSALFSQPIQVALADEFSPFLHPSQYVSYTAESQTVAKAQELAKSANTDLDVVESVYKFVVGTIVYDYDKIATIQSDYLPIVDDTLSTKSGICFDYAAIMTAMLRSQKIPSKLVIGYAGEVYHAWISVYSKQEGWIDKIIQFDGTQWTMMDPTFAATGDKAKDYVGDGTNYKEMFIY